MTPAVHVSEAVSPPGGCPKTRDVALARRDEQRAAAEDLALEPVDVEADGERDRARRRASGATREGPSARSTRRAWRGSRRSSRRGARVVPDQGDDLDARAVVEEAPVAEVEALVVGARGLAADVGGIGVGDDLGEIVVRAEEDRVERLARAQRDLHLGLVVAVARDGEELVDVGGVHRLQHAVEPAVAAGDGDAHAIAERGGHHAGAVQRVGADVAVHAARRADPSSRRAPCRRWRGRSRRRMRPA